MGLFRGNMFWVVFLRAVLISSAHFINPYPKAKEHKFEGDAAGKTLVLTPYLKAGKASEARSLSLVTGLEPNMTSYAGFLTVDEECDSNLFFWYFPSQNDPLKDPVSVWLQGGPGSTSFFGLLTENGPYNLRLDGTLERREYSWNRNSSMIYIDNPVGTGYSYTGSRACYANDETQVGQNLLSGLEQFFEVFPEISKNPLFLTGESYAGKYIPALAYTILKANTSLKLEGIMIGNGLVDPVNQQNYSAYTYQLGLIDAVRRDDLAFLEEVTRQAINAGRYELASYLMNQVLGQLYTYSEVESFYNFLGAEPEADIDSFVIQAKVRAALNVGNATWHDGFQVSTHLNNDIPVSVRPWLEELLENYRVLIFNGQLDIIVAYPLTVSYLQKLEWSGAEEYRAAPRRVWRVGGDIAGYAKSAGDFTEVLVRNAGHMVPTDQPVWALDLYNKFIFNQPIGDPFQH